MRLNQEAIIALRTLLHSISTQIQEWQKNKTHNGKKLDPYMMAITLGTATVIASIIHSETGHPEDMERFERFEDQAREAREEMSRVSFFGFDVFLRTKINAMIVTSAEEPDNMKAAVAFLETLGSARTLAAMTGAKEDFDLANTVSTLSDLTMLKIANGPGGNSKKVTLH